MRRQYIDDKGHTLKPGTAAPPTRFLRANKIGNNSECCCQIDLPWGNNGGGTVRQRGGGGVGAHVLLPWNFSRNGGRGCRARGHYEYRSEGCTSPISSPFLRPIEAASQILLPVHNGWGNPSKICTPARRRGNKNTHATSWSADKIN